jgi:hypothetical protein
MTSVHTLLTRPEPSVAKIHQYAQEICALLGQAPSLAVAVTGSVAYGSPRPHDLDLITIVDRQDIERFVKFLLDADAILENCDLENATRLFKEGKVDVLFLRGKSFLPVTIEVYNEATAHRCLALEKFTVTRYRDYPSLKYCPFLSYRKETQKEMIYLPCGADLLSLVENVIEFEGDLCIGNHINKLVGAKWKKDMLNMQLAVQECLRTLHRQMESGDPRLLLNYFVRRNRFSDDFIKQLLKSVE